MNAGNDWIDQARRLLDALDAGNASAGGASAEGASAEGHAADCRWCPVCQVAAVVRGERPELTAALADVLTATATALRAFAGDPAEPSADGFRADAEEPDEAGEPPVVHRIDIA